MKDEKSRPGCAPTHRRPEQDNINAESNNAKPKRRLAVDLVKPRVFLCGHTQPHPYIEREAQRFANQLGTPVLILGRRRKKLAFCMPK